MFLITKLRRMIIGIKIRIFLGNSEIIEGRPFIIEKNKRRSKKIKIITDGIRAGKRRKEDKKSNLTSERREREPPHPGQ